PSLTRSNSSARAISPPASERAFLHSIMGASVFSRNSLTIAAVISAMFAPARSDEILTGRHYATCPGTATTLIGLPAKRRGSPPLPDITREETVALLFFAYLDKLVV